MPVHVEVLAGAAASAAYAFDKGIEYAVKAAIKWVVANITGGLAAAVAKLSGVIDKVAGLIAQCMSSMLNSVGFGSTVFGLFVGCHVE